MKRSTWSLLLGSIVAVALWDRWNQSKFRDFFYRKTVLITGGSRGLGLILARKFLGEGAQVAICSRDKETLKKAAEHLKSYGEALLTIPCDITDNLQVNSMVQDVRNQFGAIDVLINNAGSIEVGPMESMIYKDYEDAMKIHLWGPLNTINAVLPYMKQRQMGRIVNISSIGGKISLPHLLPYSTSKFALTGFSEGLRAELVKDNIAVTTVIPGLMRTGSPLNAFFKGKNRSEYTWFSLADSLPFLSMNAERAADQIIRACRVGKAEITLSPQAFLAARFHGLFPGVTLSLLGLFNRLLPSPNGITEQKVSGRASTSKLTRSFLTKLTKRAAAQNNES